MEIAHRQAEQFRSARDYGIEAAFAAGLLLTLTGLYSLHLRHEHALSKIGSWSFRIAAAGQGVLRLIALGTLMRGHDVLGPLFPVAVLAWAAGTLTYAAATMRARILPRPVPAVLAVGTLVPIAINPGGALVPAAVWPALMIMARGPAAVTAAIA